MLKIILASQSKVRKKILDEHNILNEVRPSNVDEDVVKSSLLKEKASPEIISKNLAELKANKISGKYSDNLVLGADSVIDLNGELISKPDNREEALEILRKLNGKKHYLISSVCISKNGSMVWNHTDKATLTMKKMNDDEAIEYLSSLRQIGRWSAEMILLFTYNRSNIWPIQDIGLLRAISNNYKKKYLPPDKFVSLLKKRFLPYCSVATWYLWRSIDPEPIQY